MKKKILVSLLILGLVAGCGKVPKLANGEEAVVSFDKAENGISATELYNKIKKNYALSSLIDMIDSKILLEKYSNKKDDAKKYVDEQLTSVKNYYVDDNGKYNEESLLNTLKTYYGISTIDEFKTMLELSYYRDLAITDYAKENVTDKQIKKYYDEETVGDNDTRIVMRLNPAVAPFKAAVLPLSKKLEAQAREIEQQLAKYFNVLYDDTGSIGKRYRRQDAVGTPFCITVDFDTENDGAVTIRERDSMQQIRLPIGELKAYLEEKVFF